MKEISDQSKVSFHDSSKTDKKCKLFNPNGTESIKMSTNDDIEIIFKEIEKSNNAAYNIIQNYYSTRKFSESGIEKSNSFLLEELQVRK